MALGAFGSYLGGALGSSANLTDYQNVANYQQSQQNVLNNLMNMQAQNQSLFGLSNALAGTSTGPYAGPYAQQYVPPPVPQDPPPKKKRRHEPIDYHATDESGFDDMYFEPGWKRRLMKKYPEGCVIGGFVKRLAFEIDCWHANAAGFPA